MSDQCSNCEVRGDYKKCLETECFHHENWISIKRIDRIEELENVLKKIAKWVGEFPDTEEFVDEEKTRPASYGFLHGSNGERDYMRNMAREILNT